MPTKAGSRCALQVGRDRRLSYYPDSFGMQQDVCDVTLWLVETSGVSPIQVWVERHYSNAGGETAGVAVMTSVGHDRGLTEAARKAFLALGYVIENSGADIYRYPVCDGHHSKHEAIKAYGRIERALRNWRSQ